ncbi:MAG TPA: DUF3540 domain-containing protein [Steroidobacteraceae bacterium]|nr:DUF3540 domain-containing protein [Steroidobacteraceae bacterium]
MYLEASVPAAGTARQTAVAPTATAAPSLEFAHVLSGGRVAVRGRRVAAQRAASLLIEPEVGDSVLVATAGDGSCWILSVLERQGGQACLSVQGAEAVRLRAPALHLDVAGELRADADQLTLRSRRVNLFAAEVQTVVSKLVTRCSAWLLSCQHATVSSRNWLHRTRHRVTVVNETDQLDAARVVMRAETNVTVEAEQLQLLAAQNVQVNGERILMG